MNSELQTCLHLLGAACVSTQIRIAGEKNPLPEARSTLRDKLKVRSFSISGLNPLVLIGKHCFLNNFVTMFKKVPS